jgi:adenosylcobyric acid synthase
MGKTWQTLPARGYYERQQQLWSFVTTAFDSLRQKHDLIIIEGAGSPVELNLKHSDIVNMAMARYADAPVLLVGDIDRGGIFAQMLGTLDLFEPEERALVKGLIVNKFRGDISLFRDGINILQERGGVPVLGVMPYIPDLTIPEEDAVSIEVQNQPAPDAAQIDIAVIRLPRIANFDDFDPLARENGVSLRYISSPDEVRSANAIIIPGTKSTVVDLYWLRERGFADFLTQTRLPIVGICGGYQMLGRSISDPMGVEADDRQAQGLGLLPIETTFAGEKFTYQTQGEIRGAVGWLRPVRGQSINGYEIHWGKTVGANPWLKLTSRNGETVSVTDGCISADGRIWGCHLHGLFANDNVRRSWLASLGWHHTEGGVGSLDAAFDLLADVTESALDMDRLLEILAL